MVYRGRVGGVNDPSQPKGETAVEDPGERYCYS